ncbi:hypothetical protein PC116_g13222 [Phytophthora cactorum]|uniref:Beta-adaptin appendage C-terminal subdomain domain-containing protein n=1 Tax=Phytophthora cactorum TaxID=29920 RepID=A0A329SJX7_9STRA|nr:hypothetical protein Pcac1_g9928 [Phytophthora cactorum]KAG2825352.1 hypothetical protein PC112_g9707 [Phytophthora cactorum]KAG2829466.1 hypothetical protein PC111_g7750 [Phytophthora cactorum]KAG2858202.1 hypothetical protein PC113_g10036 [Phytophthora cactorum]KAG2905436.1 hypothetical protein PC114_g11549 [Phytophthora cactorum]
MQQSAEDAAAELQRRHVPSSTSIFNLRRQPEDRGVVSKSSGRSSSSTPRNLIVPDLTDIGEAQLPTAPPEGGLPVSGPARKYLQTDGSSGPPVEPKHKISTRAKVPRSLRGKLHFYCGDGKAAAGAVRSARRALGHLSLQQGIAFLMLLAGMLSESGTPAPRYNVPIAIGLILLPATEDDSLQREHHRLYITGLALATAIDFVWLMRPQEGAFNGYFVESTKSFTDVGIALCSFAKISLIFCNYLELVDSEPPLDDDSEEARKAPPIPPPSFRLWDKLKFFFPRRTLPRRSQLSLEVLYRVLVLAWIHLICGLLLLGLGLISTAWYSGRTQFRVNPVGIPLYIMLLLKSATTLLTYLTVSHRINYDACLELYGLRTRDSNSRVREVDGVQIRLPQEPVLAYNRAWLHRVQRAKALDGIAGGYLLLVFYAALRSGQVVGGRGVPAMLACIALVQIVLDVWTPLLILVAGRCGLALYALHHRGIPGTDPLFPPQLRWDDSDEDDSDDDSDSSDDDSDDSDSNGVVSYHSSSSSGDSDRTPAERRERRLRHQQQRLENLRASPREPQLPIVDADAFAGDQTARSARDIATARDIVDNANTSGKGAWVRHWHEASQRAYLVHSITGEAVWEVSKSTTPPMSARQLASARESVRLDSARFSPQAFDKHWNELADGGGFNCRVSRIPEIAVLARHLHDHDFIVVSDGLGVSQQRTVLFYAEDFEDGDPGLMFMGEFVFASLSLKLRARFRCAEPEQIVQFVKRLQLKEIVGAYAPCD